MPTAALPEGSLDSAYLIGFEKLRELLDDVLHENSGLNFTQFRLLLKSAEKEGDACLLSELADMLHLQPNVVSQASNVLEDKGLIVRIVSKRDARAKRIEVTTSGRATIEALNPAFRDRLYESFNPKGDPEYRKELETTIYAAAAVETSLSRAFIAKHTASAALITYSIVLQRIVDALHDAIPASFNECRILQRLSEVGQPMRAVDLATQLVMPATTITRSATRLEKRGWVVRMASNVNRQAVFLDTTPEGVTWAARVVEAMETASDEVLWSHFTERQRVALKRVGEEFLSQMHEQDSLRRYALLEGLHPMNHQR